MPAKPWQSFLWPPPDTDLVALLSYLPLKSYSRLPPFMPYTAQVIRQLGSAEGLVGYSLLARPLSKKAWTLSAWVSSAALEDFAQDPPHIEVMSALPRHLKKPAFVLWPVKSTDLPLTWPDALARFANRGS